MSTTHRITTNSNSTPAHHHLPSDVGWPTPARHYLKIDTDDGKRLAAIAPGLALLSGGVLNHLGNPWSGPTPSRTCVGNDGNATVANRHFEGRRPMSSRSWQHFIDRDGDGYDGHLNGFQRPRRHRSRRDPAMADTNGNGIIDSNEIKASDRLGCPPWGQARPWAVPLDRHNGSSAGIGTNQRYYN